MILPSKLNILIDGQFGSTGKGLVASFLGVNYHVDLAVSNASPNAGHTFYINSTKYIAKHLPVSGIINEKATIYLCAGAVINPSLLIQEIKSFNIDPSRIYIHPRATIVEPYDISAENEGGAKKIASTMQGVGSALTRKINRTAKLAGDCEVLSCYIRELDLEYYLDSGCNVLMETPQGLDLSINSGFAYPYCTSREITVSSAMSDAQVHPTYLGNVYAVIRTYPIRVGNIIEGEKLEGYSGPFYPDSEETTWEKIGVAEEVTTVTNRVRRVATFSIVQYKKMLKILKPNYIFLTFANYMTDSQLNKLLAIAPEVTHVSFGPGYDRIFTR